MSVPPKATVKCVGYGESLPHRYLDACAQLPAGDYTVECVSTPTTVYTDVRGRTDDARGMRRGNRYVAGMARYEGQRVCRS